MREFAGDPNRLGKRRMHRQQAAAGAARATIDGLAESPVVCQPLVNEPVELSMLTHAKFSDCILA